MGYDTVEISEVEVLAGKTTQIDVVLNEVAQGLEEVVITSTAKKKYRSCCPSPSKAICQSIRRTFISDH